MSTRYSLRDLGLSAGQSRTEHKPVELEPYHQGGFAYATAGGEVEARLDIDQMTQGRAFRLRFDADVAGPCSRCLEEARLALSVDSHEVHDPEAQDPQLVSDFVDEAVDELDVSAWAQDALGLEFPVRVLCQEDCQGLCAQCGTNLNEGACDCTVETSDSRWDKLRELKLDGAEG